MEQYVDIVSALSDEIKSESAEELKKHLLKVKQAYLPQFENLQNALQLQYNKTTLFPDKLISIEERAQRAQDIRLKIYASSKGGADILPMEEIENAQEKLYNNTDSELKKNLKILRNQAYNIFNENEYKILTGKMMALIYSLKAQLTGIEEKFAFLYEGDSGYAETVTVPVTDFLSNSSILEQMTLQVSSIMRWTGTDDHSLRFNSSILNQIKNMHRADNDLLNGLENGANLLNRYYNIKEYGTYEKVIKNKDGYINKPKKPRGKRYVIRIDEKGKYYVIDTQAKFQRGFISQGLLGEIINDENSTFIGDNREFYQNADIKDKFGQEYSVKSFLDGQLPSLIGINTLYSVSSEIIKYLSTTDLKEMGQGLTEIFHIAKIPLDKINKLVNQDIENTINKILSG